MGTVDLVVKRGNRFRRVYAMKRLRPEYASDSEVRTMFLDEGHLCGLLRHPNVVSVLDVGQDAEGPYMVMEYVDGLTCSDIARDALRRDTLVPEQVVLRIIAQAARGLKSAHDLRDPRGKLLEVVHRDISPQNILIGYDGLARLSDFGVARSSNRDTETRSGVLKGKISYTAPEVLRFEPASRQSDHFALGVVLWELLAARRMYRGELREVARQICNEPVPDIDEVRTDVHPAVVELLFRLLAKDPGQRPSNAQEIVQVLEAVIAERVEMEGVASIDGYLHAHFADALAENEQMVAHALQISATQPLDDEDLSLEPESSAGRTVPVKFPAADPPSAGGRPPWRRGVAIAAGVAVVALGAWLLSRPSARPEEALAPAVAPTDDPASDERPPSAPPAAIQGPDAPPAAAPERRAEEASPPAEVTMQAAARRRGRRSRRSAMMRAERDPAPADSAMGESTDAPSSPFDRNPYTGR